MSADEFETIAKLFAPLAGEGARGLMDDAALIEGHDRLVITKDAIVEGVHFLPTDPIETVAQKALRVNFSDLAAKGAKPLGVLIALIWPTDRSAAEIAAFARGLGEDLKRYEATLLGGDTTNTPGPLTISVTAIGVPWAERTPARADAQIGEDLWVTGAIGDGVLGLDVARANAARDADETYLLQRYRTPDARTAFARAVAELAGAAMDVSDGLIGDAAKIAAASKVKLRIEAGVIPISPAARRRMTALAPLITGGDDYEILFTAPLSRRVAVAAAAAEAGLPVTRIGRAEAGEGVALIGSDGAELPLPGGGHTHRLGR